MGANNLNEGRVWEIVEEKMRMQSYGVEQVMDRKIAAAKRELHDTIRAECQDIKAHLTALLAEQFAEFTLNNGGGRGGKKPPRDFYTVVCKEKEAERKREERRQEADVRKKKAEEEIQQIWENYRAAEAKRKAEFLSERKLKTAAKTQFVDTCATVEVVPVTEVVFAVDDVPVDEMDVGSEVKMAEPVVDIPIDLGNEEQHVASIAPPLVCVVPEFSLQVQAHLQDIQAAHIYHDPFLVQCRPFDFVVADYFVRSVHLYKRLITEVFASRRFLAVRHYEGLLTHVRPRLLFDPGGFEDESFRTGRE